MIKIQFIQIILYVYFTIVIICVILFYYYFLNLHMNYNNYEYNRGNKFNNDRIDLNNILLNENISKRQQESYYMNFKNRALFNYEILKDNIYYIFNYCITNVKRIIKRYKYNKLNTDDIEDNVDNDVDNDVKDDVIDDYLYNNDVYINREELNSDEYYSKYPYFNYELNNVNINSVNSNNSSNPINHSNNAKSIPELVQKSNMKNSLNLDLTSTINTDEIYNNGYNESSTFDFSITRVDSDDDGDTGSFDSCLNNSLIK